MKVISQNNLNDIKLVRLHGVDFLSKFRYAGKIVAETISILEKNILEKNTISTAQLDEIAENYIIKNNCSATFKNYGSGSNGKPFPNAVCISVNNVMVHGIPSDYILQDGDKVSFDLGATFEGAIADSAITMIFGQPSKIDHAKLIDYCRESLYKGISAVKIDNKIGCIGNAVYKSAKGNGCNVIPQYGGHSISIDRPHSDPFVSNKSTPNEGVRMQPGLILAIEPQLTFGSTETKVSSDGWSVLSKDIAAHFEHSIYLHEDNTVEVLTKRYGEQI